MTPIIRVPQTTLVFLFLTVFAALLLHASRLPVWLLVYSCLALAWRGLMFRGFLPKPIWPIKLILVCAGFSGVYVSYGVTITIESMVSLLIAGIMLKPLEVERQSDSYLLVFLNYFLCSLLFLFGQSPLDFVLSLIVICMTLAVQVLIHFYNAPNRLLSIKIALSILLKSIPLALFLFFVLPRIGPLWTLNIPTQSGVVGLSDSMSPGSLASLGENNDLAFRVKITEGELPKTEYYWRAFTLAHYDGSEWRRSRNMDYLGWSVNSKNIPEISYEVIIEPHEKHWLFTLGVPTNTTSDYTIQHDGTIKKRRKLYNPWQYQNHSSVGPWIYQDSLTNQEQKQYLQLPANVNPKAREFSQQVFLKSNGDVLLFLSLMQKYISDNEYSYTLQPGVYDGQDQIDDFLFDSKSGFCSYYAGTLAFMLRSIGIPSRVVVGYLGAEENKLSETLNVYQRDAHAWVEVWIEGKGWYRVDPTAWVSPDRVESGLEQALPNEFKGFQTNLTWLKEIRFRLQALDFYWNEWMLSYKGSNQQAFLQDVLGRRSASELAGILISAFAVIFLILFSFLWWNQRSVLPGYEARVYNLLCSWLKASNITTDKKSTIAALIDQLAEIHTHKRDQLILLKHDIHQHLYQGQDAGIDRVYFKQLRRRINQLRKMHKSV